MGKYHCAGFPLIGSDLAALARTAQVVIIVAAVVSIILWMGGGKTKEIVLLWLSVSAEAVWAWMDITGRIERNPNTRQLPSETVVYLGLESSRLSGGLSGVELSTLSRVGLDLHGGDGLLDRAEQESH